MATHQPATANQGNADMTAAQVKALRAKINDAYYSGDMAKWNELCAKLKIHTDAAIESAKFEFTSVDSGIHRTCLASGRVIA
jgi:hypothetical protein